MLVLFQLTAARRRLDGLSLASQRYTEVSTHSRPKAAGVYRPNLRRIFKVSTHSRPKAAGLYAALFLRLRRFQLTAARRRLGLVLPVPMLPVNVSTHSRPKAAGPICGVIFEAPAVSTHSRPKAAGLIRLAGSALAPVSTHSRPKAAGGPLV